MYTNVVAKMTLEFASHVGKLLNKTVPSEWSVISKNIAIPVDKEKDIHLEYDGYNGTKIKQVCSLSVCCIHLISTQTLASVNSFRYLFHYILNVRRMWSCLGFP